MKNELHFDVNSIIKIEIHDRTKTSYKWLPARQRTWFFGFLKRNSWQDEGWYPYGCYEEGSSMTGDSWEATPSSKERLIEYGYQVDPDKSVWDRPHIDIHLKNKHSIRKKFETFEDAKEYVEDIKEWSNIKFYIIVNG
jgi:hypothetical protein